MNAYQGRSTRALIDEFVELERALRRTPILIPGANGAIRIHEGVRDLLARKRFIIHELRLRRALHRSAAQRGRSCPRRTR